MNVVRWVWASAVWVRGQRITDECASAKGWSRRAIRNGREGKRGAAKRKLMRILRSYGVLYMYTYRYIQGCICISMGLGYARYRKAKSYCFKVKPACSQNSSSLCLCLSFDFTHPYSLSSTNDTWRLSDTRTHTHTHVLYLYVCYIHVYDTQSLGKMKGESKRSGNWISQEENCGKPDRILKIWPQYQAQWV